MRKTLKSVDGDAIDYRHCKNPFSITMVKPAIAIDLAADPALNCRLNYQRFYGRMFYFRFIKVAIMEYMITPANFPCRKRKGMTKDLNKIK